MCAYARVGTESRLLFEVLAPEGAAWQRTDGGFSYQDLAGASDGLRSLVMRTNQNRIRAKVRGMEFQPPMLPLTGDPVITVQLRNSVGSCWGATYSKPSVNSRTRLHARSD